MIHLENRWYGVPEMGPGCSLAGVFGTLNIRPFRLNFQGAEK
jgi:hypothetical protein